MIRLQMCLVKIMHRIGLLIVLSLLIVNISSFAIAGDKAAMDTLIVYGEGFAFAVREPEGWIGDIQNAYKFGTNILFYRKSETIENFTVLIRVRMSKKADENTQADLEYDMEGYKSKYGNIKFKDISVSHPLYKTYPKLFFVPDTFFEYVVYINPGAGIPQIYSASMNKQKTEATEEELAVFRSIVGSIRLLSSDLKIRK